MSADHPAAPAYGDEHATDDHAADEHGHDEPVIGPVDVPAWAAAIAGIVIGVVVAFCFALATTPV